MVFWLIANNGLKINDVQFIIGAKIITALRPGLRMEHQTRGCIKRNFKIDLPASCPVGAPLEEA